MEKLEKQYVRTLIKNSRKKRGETWKQETAARPRSYSEQFDLGKPLNWTPGWRNLHIRSSIADVLNDNIRLLQ